MEEKGNCYGEAEKCFDGDMAESDAELFQEATLDAKKNLYKHLTKEDKTLTVRMNGVKKLYEYSEEKMRRVVLFVAKSDVEIQKRESLKTWEKVGTDVYEKIEAKNNSNSAYREEDEAE